MGVNFSESDDAASWGYWDEEDGSAPAAGTIPEPWDIAISEGVASFSNCMYRRGPVTMALTVVDVSVSAGTSYLAAKVNTEDGTAEVISGASLAAVTDASIPDDPTFIKVPLYKLETTDGNTSVIVDYRKAANLTLYV